MCTAQIVPFGTFAIPADPAPERFFAEIETVGIGIFQCEAIVVPQFVRFQCYLGLYPIGGVTAAEQLIAGPSLPLHELGQAPTRQHVVKQMQELQYV